MEKEAEIFGASTG